MRETDYVEGGLGWRVWASGVVMCRELIHRRDALGIAGADVLAGPGRVGGGGESFSRSSFHNPYLALTRLLFFIFYRSPTSKNHVF